MKHTLIKNGQLTFTDGRFYEHQPSSEWVPSVTTILEAWPKPYALLQWMKEQGHKADEIMEAAGKRGTSVHNLTERFDRGEVVSLFDDNGKPVCSLEEWGMFERYVDFSSRYGPAHLLIEETFINPKLGWAGTVDRVMELNDGRRLIVDIKTSNGIYDSYWLQLAAYNALLYHDERYMSMDLDGAAILWLNAKTRTDREGQGKGWQLLTIDRVELAKKLRLFDACREIWLETCGDRKPRQWTYELKHHREVIADV